MKTNILLAFLCLFIYSINAQQVDTYQINQMKSQLTTSYDYQKNNNLINGSPYLDDDFLDGKLYEKDSLVKSNISLRYNILNDQIEIKDPNINKGNEYGALLKEISITAKILFKNFKYFPGFINPSDGSTGSYLEVLEKGNDYKLLKKYSVKFQPKVEARSQYEPAKKAEYVQKTYYYVLDNNGKFIEFPNRKSQLYKTFKSQKKELKSFMRKTRIDLDDEKGILRVFNYLDRIDN